MKEKIDEQFDQNANRVIWQPAVRQTICLHAERDLAKHQKYLILSSIISKS